MFKLTAKVLKTNGIRFNSTVPVKLRFFTKENCMLCFNARQTLDNALKEVKTPIDLQVVDITKNENVEWWDKYCYDIPVLHVEKKEPVIFMHRFFKNKIIEAIE